MHYNPRIHYTYGGELRHVWSGRGRKPIALGGAPNGFSNDPNRRPTGKKAVGTRKVLPNGQVVYVGYNNSLIGRIDNATKGIRSTISNAAGNASRGVGNWLNERRRDIETAWDGQAGKGSAKDQAGQYARGGNASAARDAQDRYNRSIKGRMESAGNWLTERFGAAKKAVGGAAESARRFAENVPGNLKRAGESVRNTISNQDEREAYEKARDNLKKNNSAENRKAYDEAKSAYQNHALTKAGRAINDAKNSVGLAARNLSTNAKNAATRVGNAAKTARDLAGDVAYDVQFGAEDLKNKATQKALSVVDSTGKVVANTYNNLTGAEARKQSKIASDVVRKEEAQAKLLRKQGKTDDAVELEKQIATHKEAVKYWNKQASKSAISKATTRVGEAANNLRTGAQSFVEDITGTTRKKRNRRGYGGNSNQRQSR